MQLRIGRSSRPADSRLVRRVFMSALGGVYLVAFTSLRPQVRGLYGRRGIRPVASYLDAVRPRLPSWRERVRRVPTVFWVDASDAALTRACSAGQVGAGLLMLGVAPRVTSAALWALYLSFVSVGREFLSYQWDALLLETGLHATIVAPPGVRSRTDESPPLAAVALMRWLVFRLYFQSGLCKLQSGDPTWLGCTACAYHFQTQPLPTRLGWHVHHLPLRFQRLATLVALTIELVVPFLAFAPRRARRASFPVLSGLQGLIAGTGNYGFFNLLTVVASLWLLDDEPLLGVLPARKLPSRRAPWWHRLGITLAAVPVAALSASQLLLRLRPRWQPPRALERLQIAAAPLCSVNSYGLFAVMTTRRPDIIVEGSMDGVEWREYGFRYKPDDTRKPPRWVAPHQPRLDWQMWFAALEYPPPWFERFLLRLLEGAPDVLSLLERNPFPERPPRYVRALLYDYRMTDVATRRRTGAWWRRDLLGVYFPECTLAATGAPRTASVSAG